MSRPNPKYAGFDGYHEFCNEDGDSYGSFEVFWNDGTLESDVPGEYEPVGWFWRACFPGCLPDGDASGPFNSSRAAYRDARNT